MATSSENADIAVLQSQMKILMDTANRVETKLDQINQTYVTREEFAEFKKRWFLSHTLAAGAGSVITGVVIYILTHMGK